MAHINTCIKRTFTGFNVLFAVVGGVVLLLALVCQVLTRNTEEDMEGRLTGLIFLYLVGGATLVIAALGAAGAHRENKVCLIIFLVCMVIGTLMMFRGGVTITAARPHVEEVLESKFRSLLPLDTATEDVKSMADTLQTTMRCCGLFDYTDWQSEIPESCACSSSSSAECHTVTYKTTMSFISSFRQTKTIYRQACVPVMMRYVRMGMDIAIAVFFVMGVLALLGMVLASIMIHQLTRALRTPPVLMVPTVFSSQPPKYEELKNPPPY